MILESAFILAFLMFKVKNNASESVFVGCKYAKKSPESPEKHTQLFSKDFMSRKWFIHSYLFIIQNNSLSYHQVPSARLYTCRIKHTSPQELNIFPNWCFSFPFYSNHCCVLSLPTSPPLSHFDSNPLMSRVSGCSHTLQSLSTGPKCPKGM